MEKSTIKAISECALALKRGEVVAFPTETVYGLGASVFSPDAIAKVFELKGRPQDNPLIVHVANLEQLEMVVECYPKELIGHFWPGPLTLILPKKECVSSMVSAGLPTIGVRMPAHPMARALIEAAGPLVAPSANLSGRPSSTSAAHVRDDFGGELKILDGGECQEGLESTVLSLDPPTILRPGGVTREALEKVLGERVSVAKECPERPPSPGMKYKHYAPRARVRLVEGNERVEASPARLILHHLKGEELYARFREADAMGYEEIIVVCTPEIKSHAALMNRLIRAAQ